MNSFIHSILMIIVSIFFVIVLTISLFYVERSKETIQNNTNCNPHKIDKNIILISEIGMGVALGLSCIIFVYNIWLLWWNDKYGYSIPTWVEKKNLNRYSKLNGMF